MLDQKCAAKLRLSLLLEATGTGSKRVALVSDRCIESMKTLFRLEKHDSVQPGRRNSTKPLADLSKQSARRVITPVLLSNRT